MLPMGRMLNGGHEGEHHVHAHCAIAFLFMTLVMGAITMHFLTRFAPKVPYTVVLLIEGLLIGLWHQIFNETEDGLHHDKVHAHGLFSESLDLWTHIDPHLLLATFLPALLFADSMSLNWHVWKRCLGKCLLLATVGVVIGAGLTTLVGVYILPYNWGWTEAAMFGSCLSATDPVAIVSILKELGAPEQLTMAVSGESLLNDGTAIVLFNLMGALTFKDEADLWQIGVKPDESVTGWHVAKYFVWMSIGGVVLGAAFGYAAILWISKAKRKTNHEDGLIQVLVTLCLAYMSFFVCEFLVGVSGFLGTVAAALVVSFTGWPHFVSRETMAGIWHLIELIGNTLIFTLAGVLMARAFIKEHLDLADSLMWLCVVFACLNAIRFLMVFLVYPLLSRMGTGFSAKDAIVLSWGGMRGAVCLALACDIEINFTEQNERATLEGRGGVKDGVAWGDHSIVGDQILFMVGGCAMLSLLVNGISTGALLKWLGLTQQQKSEEILFDDVHRRINAKCQEEFEKEANKLGLNDAQRAYVKRSVSALDPDHNHSEDGSHDESFVEERRGSKLEASLRALHGGQVAVLREVFLAMLRSTYVRLIDRGILRTHGQASVVLVASADASMENLDDGLQDWQYIAAQCKKMGDTEKSLKWITNWTPKWLRMTSVLKNLDLIITPQTVCYLLVCFIQAHKQAQESLPDILKDTDPQIISTVITESQEEVRLAESFLAGMDATMTSQVRNELLVNMILEKQRRFIVDLVEEGALHEKQAHHMLEDLQKDHKRNHKARQREGTIGRSLHIELH